jgi:hypothetical protein
LPHHPAGKRDAAQRFGLKTVRFQGVNFAPAAREFSRTSRLKPGQQKPAFAAFSSSQARVSSLILQSATITAALRIKSRCCSKMRPIYVQICHIINRHQHFTGIIEQG